MVVIILPSILNANGKYIHRTKGRAVHVVMLMVFIENAPHYSIHEVMVSIFIERSMPVS